MKDFLLDQFPKFVMQNNSANRSKETSVTAENYKVSDIEKKVVEFNTKYSGKIDKNKIQQTLESLDDGDGKVQYEEWKDAEKNLKAFLSSKEIDPNLEKIPTREALTKRKKSDIVKFVLRYPTKAMEFFLSANVDGTMKVNFQGISQTLLGLGHFRAFTDKYHHVEVNGVRGTLAVKPGQNKPGYFTEDGQYLAIWDGDIIKGVPRKTNKDLSKNKEAVDELSDEELEYEAYKKEADALNEQYLQNLITAEMTAEEVRLKLVEKFKTKTGINVFAQLEESEKDAIESVPPQRWAEVIQNLKPQEVKDLRTSLGSKEAFSEFIKMCGLENYGQLSRKEIADKAKKIIDSKFGGKIFKNTEVDDAKLVGSLITWESGGKPFNINPTGNCLGIGQIWENNYLNNFDNSGEGFNPFDPDISIAKAVEYLASIYSQFEGREDAVKATVVGYNRGKTFIKNAVSNYPADWYKKLPKLAKNGRSSGTYGREGFHYWKKIDDIYHDRPSARASGENFHEEDLFAYADQINQIKTENAGNPGACAAALAEWFCKQSQSNPSARVFEGSHCWGWTDLVFHATTGSDKRHKSIWLTKRYAARNRKLDDHDNMSVESMQSTINSGDHLVVFNNNSQDTWKGKLVGNHSVIFLGWANKDKCIARVAQSRGAWKTPNIVEKYDLKQNPVQRVYRPHKVNNIDTPVV
jgi:hypothetical protein